MTAVAHRVRRGDRPHRRRAAPAARARPHPRGPAARRRRAHAAERAAGAGRAPGRGADGRAAAAGAVRRRRRRTTPRWPSCSTSTLLTGTATRDRVEIDDELAAVGADLGVERRPGAAVDQRLRAGRRARPRCWTCSPTCSPPPRTPTRGGPRARPARRADHRGPRAAAHDRPGGVAAQAVRRPPDHPGDADRGGGVAAVTAEQVRALQAAALVPRGSILTLVGDVDPAAAIAQVGGRWPAGPPSTRRASCPRRRRSPPATCELVHRPGSVQSQLRLTAAAVPRRDPALPRAAAGQPGVRRLLLLALDGEHPRGQGLHLRRALRVGVRSRAARCSASRPTWPATSPRRRCWRPATSWAGWPRCRRRRRRSTRPGRYAIGSLLISLDNQGGLASTITALAADGLDLDWLRGAPGPAGGRHAEEVAAAALRFFAPAAFTGVVVGDADVIGPGVRALGGIADMSAPPPGLRRCSTRRCCPGTRCSATRRCAPTSTAQLRGLADGPARGRRRRGPHAGRVGRRRPAAGGWDAGTAAAPGCAPARPAGTPRPRARCCSARPTASRTGRCAASRPRTERRDEHRRALRRGPDLGDRVDLRTAGSALDALGAGLFVTAAAVLNWHDAAGFCPRDGSPTHPAAAGWHRLCEAHGHEEYPRTDPAVICLVHDGARPGAARPAAGVAAGPVLGARRVRRGRRVAGGVRGARDARGGRRRGPRHPLPGQPGLAVPAQPDGRLPRRRRPGRCRCARPTARSRRRSGSPGPSCAPRWPTATGGARRAAAAARPGAHRPLHAGVLGRPRLRTPSSRCTAAPCSGPARGRRGVEARRPRARLGLVAVVPSGKRITGTVWLPPLTPSTNVAASGSRSMSISS